MFSSVKINKSKGVICGGCAACLVLCSILGSDLERVEKSRVDHMFIQVYLEQLNFREGITCNWYNVCVCAAVVSIILLIKQLKEH